MNWTEFVSSLVRSLAWPLAVVVVMLLLRRDLGDLLRRMSHGRLRWPGGEADFVLEVEQLRRDAEAIVSNPDTGAEADDDERSQLLTGLRQDLLQTARSAPVAAIESAWRLVESRLRDLVHEAGALMGVRSSGPPAWAEFLVSNGALGEGAPQVVQALLSLRNRALHDQHVESVEAAAGFVDACLALYADLLAVNSEDIRGRLHGIQ